jgi:hypothetical protein
LLHAFAISKGPQMLDDFVTPPFNRQRSRRLLGWERAWLFLSGTSGFLRATQSVNAFVEVKLPPAADIASGTPELRGDFRNRLVAKAKDGLDSEDRIGTSQTFAGAVSFPKAAGGDSKEVPLGILPGFKLINRFVIQRQQFSFSPIPIWR